MRLQNRSPHYTRPELLCWHMLESRQCLGVAITRNARKTLVVTLSAAIQPHHEVPISDRAIGPGRYAEQLRLIVLQRSPIMAPFTEAASLHKHERPLPCAIEAQLARRMSRICRSVDRAAKIRRHEYVSVRHAEIKKSRAMNRADLPPPTGGL